MALACNLTRAASLQFSTATSQVTHSWVGSTQTDTHHDYSHVGPSSLYSLGPDLYAYPPPAPFSSGGVTYAPQLAGIDLWYAKQVAYLATRLGQFSAGGKNLLAQSVICWGNELDMGAAHNHDSTPFVLVGGGGGRLKTNQLVQFPLKLDADPTTSKVVDRIAQRSPAHPGQGDGRRPGRLVRHRLVLHRPHRGDPYLAGRSCTSHVHVHVLRGRLTWTWTSYVDVSRARLRERPAVHVLVHVHSHVDVPRARRRCTGDVNGPAAVGWGRVYGSPAGACAPPGSVPQTSTWFL